MAKSDEKDASEIAARVSLADYDKIWKDLQAERTKNLELTMKLKKRELRRANREEKEAGPMPSSAPKVQTEPESPKGHKFRPYQAFCAECGERNPDFIDETRCDNCGANAGSIDNALKMSNCPNCGKTNEKDSSGKMKRVFWTPKTEEAKKRAVELLTKK